MHRRSRLDRDLRSVPHGWSAVSLSRRQQPSVVQCEVSVPRLAARLTLRSVLSLLAFGTAPPPDESPHVTRCRGRLPAGLSAAQAADRPRPAPRGSLVQCRPGRMSAPARLRLAAAPQVARSLASVPSPLLLISCGASLGCWRIPPAPSPQTRHRNTLSQRRSPSCRRRYKNRRPFSPSGTGSPRAPAPAVAAAAVVAAARPGRCRASARRGCSGDVEQLPPPYQPAQAQQARYAHHAVPGQQYHRRRHHQ